MLSAFLFIVAAFVIAGIPTGYWTVKAVKGVDVREYGSKSTGATNVWRVAGPAAGIFVFAFDTFKGYAPVAIANYLSNGQLKADWSFAPNVVPAIVAVAALVGHSKSVFLNFQGGKSAATGLGTLLGLCPPGGGMTFVVWLAVLGISKYVSLASILGVLSCGMWFALFGAPLPYVIYCVFGFIYVTYRHKANVQRLIKGEEPKIGQKKPESQAGSGDEVGSGAGGVGSGAGSAGSGASGVGSGAGGVGSGASGVGSGAGGIGSGAGGSTSGAGGGSNSNGSGAAGSGVTSSAGMEQSDQSPPMVQ